MPESAHRILNLNSDNDSLTSVRGDLGGGWKYSGIKLVTERLVRMAHQTSYTQLYNTGGFRGIHLFFRGLKFHLLSVKMYLQRIQSLKASFDQDTLATYDLL
jgi:hypothetical protein